jgi:mono/diheme cytochrome c family protein
MQVEDLVALIGSWREGVDVQPDFSVTELLDRAIYSLNNGDAESAALQVARAMTIAQGAGLEILRNAASQLASGDEAGALTTLEALRAEWPIGDPTVGAQVYSTYCAACHGPQGEGGIGPQLNPSEFIQSMSNADLVEFIQVGRPGTAMAGFADRLLEPQIADLVAFVRMWQP